MESRGTSNEGYRSRMSAIAALLLATVLCDYGAAARKPAEESVWRPISALEVASMHKLLTIGPEPGGDPLYQHMFVLFTSSSQQCALCPAASTAFSQVAKERKVVKMLFVEIDEQAAETRSLFGAAGATIGPSVLHVDLEGSRGSDGTRQWFHETSVSNMHPDSPTFGTPDSGIDYIRLGEFVGTCTGTLYQHPTSWIQSMDAEYSEHPPFGISYAMPSSSKRPHQSDFRTALCTP
jgi:hypothetical protein